jgi:hypothetical protein
MFARSFSWLATGLLVCLATAPVVAAPPWNKMVLFKHLEANPSEMYPLTSENGPWTIMAATFCGEGAEQQAQELVYEIRKQYKLPAYSYHKKFEFSKPVEGKGLDNRGEPMLMRYQRDKDLVEIAVLVGDYPTVDDPEAQRVLKKLKYAEPKSLAVEPGKATNQSLAAIRSIQKQVKQTILPKDSDELKRGPMANAFVITNPLLPNEYFVPKGIDKFVLDMNKGVPHSLLDCPKRFTVKVATFSGHAVILDKKREEAIERGDMPKSYLEEAAKSAHLLTEALRKKKYDAYEFHDRSSSIVTVGSFESVGTKRPDGKIEINPAIHTIMRTFGAEAKVEPGKPPQVGQAKKLANIPFDLQPVPVEVPRRMISTDYGRTANLR